MALTLKAPETQDLRPRITVFGVGGAGGNAVNNMIMKQLEGVEFVVANTDAQALAQSRSVRKLQLGSGVTQGLGAGAKPQVGAQAAEESLEEIVDHLAGSHMCFITAGMGGGTGTGAAPVVARAAREMGILTVGVVTKPFQFEGSNRMRLAEGGIDQLQQVVDTLIVIPNQNLFRIANERTTFADAFMMADDVLYQGVKGVTDLMVRPGIINLDFADVRSVMDEMGKAMMGTGEAAGETRAIDAAEKAIANPLLDEISLKGAKGVLINITGGYDLTLFELDEAANRIRAEVDPDANIIIGSTLDPEMKDVMRVSVVATGIDAAQARAETPVVIERAPPARPAPLGRPAVTIAAARPRPVEAPQPEIRAPAAVAQAAAGANLFETPSEEPFGDHGFDLDEGSIAPAARGAERPEPMRDNPFVAAERGDPAPERTVERTVERVAERAHPPRIAAERPAPEPVARAEARSEAPGPRPRAEAPEAEPAQPRFGFNNLIHRMTGAGREREVPAPQPAPRREPAAAQPKRDPRDEEDMRLEIPAFLRRQAN